MISPQMATMLAFLTTDAALAGRTIRAALRRAVACSFNVITVDGHTSTNDTVILMASGCAGPVQPEARSELLQRFAEALAEVCCRLAELIVADGEGATRVTKVHVRGARSDRAAERVARAVAASPLVRCSWYGAHPDWGRIVSVIGCSRDVDNIRALECRLNGVPVYARGEPLDFDERALRKSLRSRRNLVEIILSDGQGTAAILASDLTHQYVTINAEQET